MSPVTSNINSLYPVLGSNQGIKSNIATQAKSELETWNKGSKPQRHTDRHKNQFIDTGQPASSTGEPASKPSHSKASNNDGEANQTRAFIQQASNRSPMRIHRVKQLGHLIPML